MRFFRKLCQIPYRADDAKGKFLRFLLWADKSDFCGHLGLAIPFSWALDRPAVPPLAQLSLERLICGSGVSHGSRTQDGGYHSPPPQK